MMKCAAPLVALSLLSCTDQGFVEQRGLHENIDDYEVETHASISHVAKHIGRLYLSFDDDYPPGTCTGFLVSPAIIMTTLHCIDERPAKGPPRGQLKSIVFHLGGVDHPVPIPSIKEVLIDPVEVAEGADLMLLALAEPFANYADPLSYRHPQPNEELFVIGYPQGRGFSVTERKCEVKIASLSVRHSCSTKDGHSGSPLIAKSDFAVVGVHRGFRDYDPNNINRAFAVAEFVQDSQFFQSAFVPENALIASPYDFNIGDQTNEILSPRNTFIYERGNWEGNRPQVGGAANVAKKYETDTTGEWGSVAPEGHNHTTVGVMICEGGSFYRLTHNGTSGSIADRFVFEEVFPADADWLELTNQTREFRDSLTTFNLAPIGVRLLALMDDCPLNPTG